MSIFTSSSHQMCKDTRGINYKYIMDVGVFIYFIFFTRGVFLDANSKYILYAHKEYSKYTDGKKETKQPFSIDFKKTK